MKKQLFILALVISTFVSCSNTEESGVTNFAGTKS
jgi:hypothetical protein